MSWFTESNRWKHFVLAIPFSFIFTLFCAIGLAIGMEFKDCHYANGDTPILTDHGIVKIKDFNANWRVMSNGEWREVENLNIQN